MPESSKVILYVYSLCVAIIDNCQDDSLSRFSDSKIMTGRSSSSSSIHCTREHSVQMLRPQMNRKQRLGPCITVSRSSAVSQLTDTPRTDHWSWRTKRSGTELSIWLTHPASAAGSHPRRVTLRRCRVPALWAERTGRFNTWNVLVDECNYKQLSGLAAITSFVHQRPVNTECNRR